MNPLAVTTAAALLTVAFHAQPAAHAHGGGTTTHSHVSAAPSHSTPHAAMAHAQAAQQHAYEHAMHQQAQVQQHMMQQYQRSVHEQLRHQILNHSTTNGGHPATSVASAPPAGSVPGLFPLGSSSYLGSPHHAYHSPYHYYSHHYYRHHYHQPYRHHRAWPGTQDPEYAALVHLKETLDDVVPRSARFGVGSGPSHRSAIEQALLRVVEVAQPPSIGATERLAGDLEEALASRTASAVDTNTVAVALRGGMNYSALIAAERAEVVRELQAALKQGGVPPPQVAAVIASIHNVGAQEHMHHARR